MRLADVREVGIATTGAGAAPIRAAVGDGRHWDLRIRYIEIEPGAGPGAAILDAADFLGDAAFVAHTGDGLLGEELAPLLDLVAHRRRDAMVLLHAGASKVERDCLETRRMLRFAARGAPARPGVTGVACFAAGALDAAAGVATWRDRPLELSDLLARVEQGGGCVRTHTTHTWRRFTGDLADLLQLNRIALERLDPVELPEYADSHIEGTVHIDPSADIRSAVIRGPVVIGAGAQITETYIGPYTSIGDRAHIEGTEVQHSIIGADAQILHIGGPIDASVIGRGARVIRDFSLPRAIRLQIGEGVEVAFCQ